MTIARHYSLGKFCDYPADALLSAVNSFDYNYNPTAILIKTGFQQLFIADFNAFAYLSEHKTDAEIQSFLNDPNDFMLKADIRLAIPLDDIAPRIFAALVEDDMLEALKDPEGHAVCQTIFSNDKQSWRYRHPERYPRPYMKMNCLLGLRDIPYTFDIDYLLAHGFNGHMNVNLLFIVDFFASK